MTANVSSNALPPRISTADLRIEVARLRKAYYQSRANECVHRSRYHLRMWQGAASVLAERERAGAA